MRFTDYKEAAEYARKRANELKIDQAIRAVKEYGKMGYNVACASRNDSDYARAEIIMPDMQSRHCPNPAAPCEHLNIDEYQGTCDDCGVAL